MGYSSGSITALQLATGFPSERLSIGASKTLSELGVTVPANLKLLVVVPEPGENVIRYASGAADSSSAQVGIGGENMYMNATQAALLEFYSDGAYMSVRCYV